MVDANRIQCAEERYKQTFWSRSQLIRLINKWLWCLCMVSTTIQNHHHHHSENYENIQNKKYRDRRKSRNMHAYHAITNRWSIKVVCYAYKIDNSKCLPHGNGILCYESNTEQRDWYKKNGNNCMHKKNGCPECNVHLAVRDCGVSTIVQSLVYETTTHRRNDAPHTAFAILRNN